ncbi:MAG TPA: ABC transporter ATP-binding protein [Chloroflexota bacterium]|nr:ABC transporter ATP-binding protein [Chloroflexota bacterium]
MKALTANQLSKRYEGLHALREIDLEVEPGECRVIIGPNGAGKTTLFHVLSGITPPTTGRIFLYGEEITHAPDYVRAGKGLARTFQVSSLFRRLTVEQNVLLAVQPAHAAFAMHRPATSYGPAMARVDEVLELGGLATKRGVQARHLSHGEQRQLEVMLALSGQPKVVLLDEPTAGLSEGERKSMTAFLQKLRGAVTIVLVSHDVDVAFELADRITVLHLGEALVEGTPETVRRDERVSQIYLGTEAEQARA